MMKNFWDGFEKNAMKTDSLVNLARSGLRKRIYGNPGRVISKIKTGYPLDEKLHQMKLDFANLSAKNYSELTKQQQKALKDSIHTVNQKVPKK